jgi:alpha-mannosidase
LSEGDYGVSLLNDCKYGFDIKDNVMRISLLRSPTMPDPDADQGRHTFAYSLLVHPGTWGKETISGAYQLNDPLISFRSEIQKAKNIAFTAPFITTDRDNVVIETIKRAEDGNGFIVRLYESRRARGKFTIKTGFKTEKCFITDLLENNIEQVTTKNDQAELYIKPYQILNLRIIPRK